MCWLIMDAFVYILSLLALLWVTKHARHWYAAAKATTSFLFILTAVLAFKFGTASKNTNLASFILLLAALVFCAGGDLLLGLANKHKKVRAKPFVAGAISFCGAHLLFCIYFYVISSFSLYDIIIPTLSVIFVLVFNKLDFVRLKKMKTMALLYSFLVGLMVSKALQFSLFGNYTLGHRASIGVGAVLFFASDVILLFLYFGTSRHKMLRYLNLSSYYIGVYFIALSAFWALH